MADRAVLRTYFSNLQVLIAVPHNIVRWLYRVDQKVSSQWEGVVCMGRDVEEGCQVYDAARRSCLFVFAKCVNRARSEQLLCGVAAQD